MNLVVLEIRQAEESKLSLASELEIGRMLALEAGIVAVWITEDGDTALRGVPRLQLAVMGGDGESAARMILPVIERVQEETPFNLAVAYSARKRPDTTPREVADLLGIDVIPNRSILVTMLKQPRCDAVEGGVSETGSEEVIALFARIRNVAQFLGGETLPRYLGVSQSRVNDWLRGTAVPDGDIGWLIVELDQIVAWLRLLWRDDDTAQQWLNSGNAFLKGSRPVDLLVVRDYETVRAALEAHRAGAFG